MHLCHEAEDESRPVCWPKRRARHRGSADTGEGGEGLGHRVLPGCAVVGVPDWDGRGVLPANAVSWGSRGASVCGLVLLAPAAQESHLGAFTPGGWAGKPGRGGTADSHGESSPGGPNAEPRLRAGLQPGLVMVGAVGVLAAAF